MKKLQIRLFCLSILAILASITSTSAKDFENIVYNEFTDMISEVEQAEYLDSEAHYNVDSKTVATALLYAGCYELKRVWTWSGWRPKRVWKWVKITCPQAASSRGPGTTIPPH